MMFKHLRQRSDEKETMDDLHSNHDELRKNLDELEAYNQWLGSKKELISVLNQIHKKYSGYFEQHSLVIADLGCGSGDLLRAMDEWATSKKLRINLIGIDANPFVIDYAIEKSQAYSTIEYKKLNIFSPEFAEMRFDIVTMNSVCHHFDDTSLIQLLKQLATQSRLAIIINDLHRHWLSYAAICCLNFLSPFSHLWQHDAPLSVRRAFRKKELLQLLTQSGITSAQIRWAFVFRWIVIISLCTRQK